MLGLDKFLCVKDRPFTDFIHENLGDGLGDMQDGWGPGTGIGAGISKSCSDGLEVLGCGEISTLAPRFRGGHRKRNLQGGEEALKAAELRQGNRVWATQDGAHDRGTLGEALAL